MFFKLCSKPKHILHIHIFLVLVWVLSLYQHNNQNPNPTSLCSSGVQNSIHQNIYGKSLAITSTEAQLSTTIIENPEMLKYQQERQNSAQANSGPGSTGAETSAPKLNSVMNGESLEDIRKVGAEATQSFKYFLQKVVKIKNPSAEFQTLRIYVEICSILRFCLSSGFLNVFCDYPAEPSEEAGGDKNSRWQKTNHTSLYRPAGHGVKKKHKAWLRIRRNCG